MELQTLAELKETLGGKINNNARENLVDLLEGYAIVSKEPLHGYGGVECYCRECRGVRDDSWVLENIVEKKGRVK